MEQKHCIVAGALGISGRALVEELNDNSAWKVTGLSRRTPNYGSSADFVSVDLLDVDSCRQKISRLHPVTHIFYTAHARDVDPGKEADLNVAMLRNLVTAAELAGRLQHVVVLHGTKWYGNHLGPFKTPALEDDPRHMPPNFYYDQQDWLATYQSNKPWAWTAFRPHCICGLAIGSPMSHLIGLAVYASISRELGLPLRFPGSPTAFHAVYQYTEASLLARAMLWATEEPRCRNEAFNMTNGEVERWVNIWPAIAQIFGMESAPVQTISLARFMADKEPVWKRMQDRYGLHPYPLASLVDWAFLDWAYSSGFDQISSLGKARRAGWTESVDSVDMFRRQIKRLGEARIIPRAPGS